MSQSPCRILRSNSAMRLTSAIASPKAYCAMARELACELKARMPRSAKSRTGKSSMPVL